MFENLAAASTPGALKRIIRVILIRVERPVGGIPFHLHLLAQPYAFTEAAESPCQ